MLTEFQVGESGIPKGSKEKVIMHFLELAGRHNWVPPRGDETTSARQQEDSDDSHDCNSTDSDDSHDCNSTDSDDSNSSVQFELERIVSGPCKSGPNKDKCFIKWVGYDSDDNTWEPPAHISSDDLREYENEMQNSSDSDEDRTPIANLCWVTNNLEQTSYFSPAVTNNYIIYM